MLILRTAVMPNMNKMEYEPLYNAGFNDISLDDIPNVFVEPFNPKDRREYLIKRFNVLLERFKETGLEAEVWIDGSFATTKPEPNDIDVIFFIDGNKANALSPDKQKILIELSNRQYSQIRYQCDVFVIPNQNQELRSYWRGWFGFSREEVPKGIVRIFI